MSAVLPVHLLEGPAHTPRRGAWATLLLRLPRTVVGEPSSCFKSVAFSAQSLGHDALGGHSDGGLLTEGYRE